VDRLDFDRGLEFQDVVRLRFKSPVHHPYPSLDGSFFLLVTFRRFLFRLTEESVALALQSCLGGRSSDFHVKFLSNNHFRFSVFSKEVGFYVYNLRRVTTSFFDVYFHLWNNGTPHWEREKRAWEIKQEKEWTLVLSKSSKKEVKRKENLKRVHFAKPIVQPPPKNNHQPSISLIFGSFSSQFDPSSLSQRMVFGPSSILRRDPVGSNGEPKNTAPPMPRSDDPAPFPNSKSLGCLLKCFRCLDLGHTRRYCRSKVRCAQCFKAK
jgi:hypothetical protein